MTTLEIQQRGLLAIIKNRPVDTKADAWLERIAGSRQAAMVSEIALWWRRFQIESQCRYTSRLLKRLGIYQLEVQKYFESAAASPYIEKLATGFLRSLTSHAEPLVASVAKFELACLAVNESVKRSRIVWDRNPETTIRALEQLTDLPPAEIGHFYSMELGLDIPGRVACSRFSHP
jgi:hypothetical protein